MLSVCGLSKSFEGRCLFSGLSLELEQGQHCLVYGVSGAGKSTFLHLVARLDEPSEGALFFDGKSYADLGSATAFRRQNIGLVFQDIHLIESLSVAQNVEMIACATGHSLDPMTLLEPLGLGRLAHQSVRTLSRGERQRVGLARAFANNPRLILADEPTSSLDSENRTACLDQVFDLAKQYNTSILLVSHDQSVGERQDFAHRVQILPPQ